jgi:hypothetical protein
METQATQHAATPDAPNAPLSREPDPGGPPGAETTPQAATRAASEAHEATETTANPTLELRAAAAKLRKHVKHATDSPWVTSSVWSPRATATSGVYSHAHPAGSVDSEVVASGRIRAGYGGIREPWNAEYIALMQPSVGAALVLLLDLEADVIEGRAMQDGGSYEFAVDLGQEHLLTIARLINAEDRDRKPVTA